MVGGTEAPPETWTENASSSEELASIAVFDSKCARLYVEKEGELAYRPYGLETFDQLGDSYMRMKRQLAEEAASIQAPRWTTVFEQAEVKAAVEALLRDETEENKKVINTLGAISFEEKKEAARLQAQITQLESDDPKKLAASRRALANRLVDTTQRITAAHSKVQKSVKQLGEAMKKATDEAELARKASSIAFSKEPVAGVGSDQWKAMFEDARTFSTEVAFQGQEFPVVGENSRCVLCHQLLDDETKDRLSRFADYIGNKAEERARLSALTFEQQRSDSLGAAKGIADIDDAMIEQVIERNEAAGNELKIIRGDFSGWLKLAGAVSAWDEWSKLAVPSTETATMKALADQIKAEADELDKNSSTDELVKLKARRSLLNDRIALSKVLPTIIEAARCETKKRGLQRLSDSINTTHVSRQATATTEQVLTKTLCEALNAELEAIDAASLKVEFAKKGDVGGVLHYLKLSKARRGTKIEDVLSEGEHRCLAIAAFLAELGQTDHTSAVVFDDPVSSLDHKHRNRVAVRLVEEAKHRQVIIFSHDLVFLYALHQASAQEQVPMRTHAVKRTSAGTGDLVDGLYPEALGIKGLIALIRSRAIETSHLDEQDSERRAKVVDCYDLIRAAWERIVEEVLLRAVVSPFDKAVHSQKLNGVLVEDADHQKVYWAMKKASDIVEAHRTAPAGGTTNIPKHDELLADIEAMDAYRKVTEGRAGELAKSRNKLLEPPSH